MRAHPLEDTELSLILDVLSRGDTVRIRARGASMIPSLWPGDLLTIRSARDEEFAPGDIVLLLRGQRLFAHRLIANRADPEVWMVRGDAMPQCDPPVSRFDIVGKVVAVSRKNRTFLPSTRISPFIAMAGWLLGHCECLRNAALYVRAHEPAQSLPSVRTMSEPGCPSL